MAVRTPPPPLAQPGQRRARRWPVVLLVVAVVVGTGVWMWSDGVGPLPKRPQCTASVGGTVVDLSPEQAENATLISAVGVRRGLPARAVSIALATAYQESKIRNLDHGDRDSLGVFQQRPSQGWGTAEQVRDVRYASNAFYDALAKVDGYQTMRITEAAQKVQRSGFPEAYEPHAEDARALASALTGYSSDGAFTCVARTPSGGSVSAARSDLISAFGALGISRTGPRSLAVPVGGGEQDQRRGWAVAQYVVAHADSLGVASVSFDGLGWSSGRDSEDGWVERAAGPRRVDVRLTQG
ncbi:hypothetical protein GCM10011519_28650 [Marmoricola endophyticus]|uniref:Heavy metal transporter n=1 Tax=Marmoricola endophyticus TaxID=2040280 RepID=A0A917BQI8_9ACTN|nr:hypothetical protein [Marmoricola endophyticus]GGF52976.1 hypothetical protein GCM10011519_28650 [Marmoricola endophyticus]